MSPVHADTAGLRGPMTDRRTHPAAFLLLILPFGVMSGYLTVAVGWRLAQAGLSVGQIAGLVALGFLPHTWKFAWAPLADVTLTRRTWYLMAAVTSAAGLWAIAVLPATAAGLPMLSAVVLVANVAVTFLGMSVESLMAHATPEHEKGRAAGWFQAGNLGGGGLGGGAGLWLAQHLPAPWMGGAILAAACAACTAGLAFVHETQAPHEAHGLATAMKKLGRDIWGMVRARAGFLALLLCFLPMCTGAASGLWSAVASDWHASANVVALVTGVFAGLLSAVGCLLGGWVCDRMDRRRAYVLYAVLQAACAAAMALAPRTEASYIVFTSLYAIITGLTYAGFSAFVLEAIGLGGAATKYNIYASLSNFPIMTMTRVEGWAHGRWGPAGMLLTEAALAVVGLTLFLAIASIRTGRRETRAAA